MEWNSGMENGMECRMYTITINLCDWCYTIKVELATMYLYFLSHRRGRISNSTVAIILPCLVTSCGQKMGFPNSGSGN